MVDKNKTEKLLKKEFQIVNDEPFPSLGISVGLKQNNYFKWEITIFGPDDTDYAEGIFKLGIEFKEEHPYLSPTIKFETKIYHCNVSEEGDINIPCINYWNENISMSQVLSDIFSLFYIQTADLKFNKEKSEEYKKNKNTFKENVKKYVNKYAK